MCGLVGTIGADYRFEAGSLMQQRDILAHRGPDCAGMEVGEGWALGFRRLSILDLSPLGRQPMCSADRKHWIALNGEIYNYVELRAVLEQKGERFTSGSDTEVLLRLLIRKGVEALSGLNGMFAFAYLDLERRTFLLARDRLGVKPLYYTMEANTLRFASELKSLLSWPGASRRVDYRALVEYLALNYLPHEMCIFEGYRKLPPGTYMEGMLDSPREAHLGRYWRISIEGRSGKREMTEREFEELSDLLSDAVRIRLRSEVPVGVFLSGGIDSGLVAKLSADAANGVRPLALTVGFPVQDYDECALAESTARAAGLEHRIVPHRSQSFSDVDRLAWYFDEPFADASALPTFALCEAAAEHATVFLSGDGGDEAFGGYRRYVESARYRWLSYIPEEVCSGVRWFASFLPERSPLRYRLLKSTLADQGFAGAFDEIPCDPILQHILHSDLKPYAQCAGESLWRRWKESRFSDLLTRQQRLDYDLYLPDDILVKVDRASMANSIEVRSPFLDYRLVEFAASIPREALLNGRKGKLPLRRIAEALLPLEVHQGVKRGFGVPLDEWFRQPSAVQFVRRRLLSKEATERGWFDTEAVVQMIHAHVSGRGRPMGQWLWRLVMLDAWARQYADKPQFMKGIIATEA